MGSVPLVRLRSIPYAHGAGQSPRPTNIWYFRMCQTTMVGISHYPVIGYLTTTTGRASRIIGTLKGLVCSGYETLRQSYANQIGKGTHRAIRNVQNAMRLHHYVLHCDIRKYFPSIDHQILKSLIRRKIKDPHVLWLIELIIDNSNSQEFVLDWFPGDDLFTPIERRKGLPIGNLTSQFFANIYLNGLDHFVKEKLRCRYYARYVDDIVAVDSNKDYLWEVCFEMEHYLEKLRLRFNPNKRHIRPVTSGFRFLGQIIFPNRRLLPKNNVRRFMRRMRKFQELYATNEIIMDQINHSLQSWLGHAKQANTYALRKGLLSQIHFRRDNQWTG